MKTLAHLALALLAFVASPGCRLVEGVVALVDLALGAVVYVVLNGGLHAAVFVLAVLTGNLEHYEPTQMDLHGARLGHLECGNCEDGEDLYLAEGEQTMIVTEGDWAVREFEGRAEAFALQIDEPGDTELTWTDGTQELVQRVHVREVADIAVFDLATGEELSALTLAVGETRDLEILGVDAEGHRLAGNYRSATADETLLLERAGFHRYEGLEDGAPAGTGLLVTGALAGEATLTVSLGGMTRELPVHVTE